MNSKFSLPLALLAFAVPCAELSANERPNIIVILADDLGFSDPGCFGGEIQTPNLDWLAKKGLRFTQFYNTARCSPTRASLLTGQYAHKVGLAANGRSLTRNCMTLAELLKTAGYSTGMVGKWHLSVSRTLQPRMRHQKWLDHQIDPKIPFAPLETYPVSRGFDKHYGIIWGVVNYFDPFSLVDGKKAIKTVPKDYYITDAINNKATEYIREFTKNDAPFFLYVAHTAPHWPLHAKKEDIAKYKGKYNGGWHKLRKQRYARQLKMGLFDKKNTPLPKLMGKDKDWDALTKREKQFMAQKLEVHAAMVHRLDIGVGQILETLRETKQLDNTLIIFLADNGASPEVPQRPGYDRTAQTRDGRIVQYLGVYIPGGELTYTGIGAFWANALNTPFRYWKRESFEGGTHTPMIVCWLGGLKTPPGETTDQTGHVIDIFPTCAELAKAKYPATFQGHKLTAIDGKSLVPIFQGKQREGHKQLFFEHTGGAALRQGDWKLVAKAVGQKKPKTWELYDLSKDRTETNDLAARYPKKVKIMTRDWNQWYQRVTQIGRANKAVK
ncbi:MAG: arylsulfatase [Gemmataceae bacterium]